MNAPRMPPPSRQRMRKVSRRDSLAGGGADRLVTALGSLRSFDDGRTWILRLESGSNPICFTIRRATSAMTAAWRDDARNSASRARFVSESRPLWSRPGSEGSAST